MRRFDFIACDDAGYMREALNGLKPDAQVVSMYTQGGRHYAWYVTEFPDVTATPAPPTPADESAAVAGSAPGIPVRKAKSKNAKE